MKTVLLALAFATITFTQPFTIWMKSDPYTGTSAHHFASRRKNSDYAILASTATLSKDIIGVAETNGNGGVMIGGSVTILTSGVTYLMADGSTTMGRFIVPSKTMAGSGTDPGDVKLSSKEVFGKWLKTATGPGIREALVSIPGEWDVDGGLRQ